MSYSVMFEFGNGRKLKTPCSSQQSRKILLEGLRKNMLKGENVYTLYNNDNEIGTIINLANVNFIYGEDEEQDNG